MLLVKKCFVNNFLFTPWVIKPPTRAAHFNFTFVTMLNIYTKAVFWRQNSDTNFICL